MTTGAHATSMSAQIGDVVGRHVAGLQAQFIDGVPTARAVVAHLRAAVTHEPGADPAVWQHTVAIVPGPVPRSDAPTRAERAVHASMTLWAIHQQGQSRPMHHPGVAIGHAVRRLQQAERSSAEAITRRFMLIVTADSWDEAVHHLRSLVTQLRRDQIPLDYGRLARDLWSWQYPDGAVRVRLAWGRQFHQQDTVHRASEDRSHDAS